MSDSSDDKPLAAKRAKLENGSAKPQPASKTQGQPKVKKEQEISRPGAASKGNKQKAEEAEIAKESKTAKKSTKSSEGSKTGTAAVKREKKVYELPGQTRETPDELDPLRKFYMSLKQQRPESQMAKKWMCMYGLLSQEEAEAFLKEAGRNIKSPVKKQKSSQGQRGTAPQKSSAPKRSSASKRKAQAVKNEDDSEESEGKKLPAKQKPKVKKESKASKPPAQKSKGKYAVFEDMDSDSDDDKPLGMRV